MFESEEKQSEALNCGSDVIMRRSKFSTSKNMKLFLCTVQSVIALIACPLVWGESSYIPTLGWQELVSLQSEPVAHKLPSIEATLDPGQTTTSLQVHSYKISEDKKTVDFSLHDRFGKSMEYKAKLLRTANFKLSSGAKEDRPIVSLRVCLGTTWVDAEVSVKEDSQVGNPLRMGRNDIAGKILIDPSKSFSIQPSCK